MDIASIDFVAFVVTAAVSFRFLRSRTYRLTIITIANAVFIASYVTEWRQITPLLAFLVLGYVTVEMTRVRAFAGAFVSGLCAVLACYVLLKRFSFLEGLPTLPFPYLVVGLSYILFRILHLMIDARGGDLAQRVGPLAFFNYTCNFLSFVSGPIQRYQDFAKSSADGDGKLDADQVHHAFSRIIAGYVKVIIVSAIANYLFLWLSQRVLSPAAAPTGWHLALEYGACATAYTAYLYYNFSGYMDIVIGAGRLLGQNLPENFDRPFLARNFLEFWSRWHMTLSEWFKTYLFNPLMKLLIERVPQPGRLPYLGVVAFFATFFVMGLWHGTTLVFMIYGLIMGAGASVNKLWQVVMADRLGRRRYRALSERPMYLYACRGLTAAYFIVGVTCLWVDMRELGRLWNGLGPHGLLATLLLLALTAAMAMRLQDVVVAWARSWFAWAMVLSRRGLAGSVWSAAQILAILMLSSFFHKTPEFVYRAF